MTPSYLANDLFLAFKSIIIVKQSPKFSRIEIHHVGHPLRLLSPFHYDRFLHTGVGIESHPSPKWTVALQWTPGARAQIILLGTFWGMIQELDPKAGWGEVQF